MRAAILVSDRDVEVSVKNEFLSAFKYKNSAITSIAMHADCTHLSFRMTELK